jgi:hypothetical protein
MKRVFMPVPGFQHGSFARFKDEHRVPVIVLAEKEIVLRNRHGWTQREQELKDLCPDSAKDRHLLQEFDPHFLHGALQCGRNCDKARNLARLRS